jgi:Raf kinase inhibitor-like YbhB/YbcL family protein
MKLTSPAFSNGGKIPAEYSKNQGENIPPPLEVKDVPAGTKSLVLIMDDPDVPPGRYPGDIFDHWIFFNIPPTSLHLTGGTHGQNSAHENNYFGPAPPDREHRYFFKLYALDTMLDLRVGATKKQVEKAMENHILAKAELMGRYEQP